MSERKRKSAAVAPVQPRRVWRDDIVGDVFELWLGISRLMAKVHEPDRPFEPASGRKRANKRAP